MGEFETDIYPVEISLGDLLFTLRRGVLPKLLEQTLLISCSTGIIGGEFFARRSVQIDSPNRVLSLRA